MGSGISEKMIFELDLEVSMIPIIDYIGDKIDQLKN